MHLRTQEVVARVNIRSSGRRKPVIFQISYDQQLSAIRTNLLRSRGYEVVSVMGNDSAQVILSAPERYDEVKDLIGEWHDWEELIAIASEVLDHVRKCKLLPRLQKISEAKYTRALAVTNQMRQRFLDFKFAKHARASNGKHSVAKFPVRAAASAITA